jgi:predicted PolB exonuclease-like 3'-5' exonuclease
MKAKLIKTGSDYLLRDMSGEVLAITNGTMEGKKLSKQNCDEIFGVVDVEKLAKNEYLDGYDNTEICRIAFKDGFNKAMELYQPTEIEVEIEMEENVIFKARSMQFSTQRAINAVKKEWFPKPKLESTGCLILKKI